MDGVTKTPTSDQKNKDAPRIGTPNSGSGLAIRLISRCQ
jgi:hypothetical protein